MLKNHRMTFIPFEYNTGQFNMDYDEKLLNDAISQDLQYPIFRLYGWKPACVSLGRNQGQEFLDKNLICKKNLDVVTRLTGGRALLHDKEVTYSIVCPQKFLQNGQSVMSSYKEISQILIEAFLELGISLTLGGDSVHTKHDYCMLVSTGADLNYNGKKLVGSAQCRKKGYILQHGSILFDYDKNLLEEVFLEQVDKSTITTVKEILPFITIEEFALRFQEAICVALDRLYQS